MDLRSETSNTSNAFLGAMPDELTCRKTSSNSPCWLQTSWVGEPGPSLPEGTAGGTALWGQHSRGRGAVPTAWGWGQTPQTLSPMPVLCPQCADIGLLAPACSGYFQHSPGLLLPPGHPLADMQKVLGQSFVSRALIKW